MRNENRFFALTGALSGGFLDTFVLTGTLWNRSCLRRWWRCRLQRATNTAAARRPSSGPLEVAEPAEGFCQPFRFSLVESKGRECPWQGRKRLGRRRRRRYQGRRRHRCGRATAYLQPAAV